MALAHAALFGHVVLGRHRSAAGDSTTSVTASRVRRCLLLVYVFVHLDGFCTRAGKVDATLLPIIRSAIYLVTLAESSLLLASNK